MKNGNYIDTKLDNLKKLKRELFNDNITSSETYVRLCLENVKTQTEKDLLDMLKEFDAICFNIKCRIFKEDISMYKKEFDRLDTLLTNIRDLIDIVEWNPT